MACHRSTVRRAVYRDQVTRVTFAAVCRDCEPIAVPCSL
jgi:hypothetical protein